MADSKHTGDFLAGLIVGSLVGAAAALLFAPQSGEETRAKIRERSIELQERAGELSSEARQRSADLQVQAREKAAGVQAKVKQVVVEGKSAATRRKEDLLTGWRYSPRWTSCLPKSRALYEGRGGAPSRPFANHCQGTPASVPEKREHGQCTSVTFGRRTPQAWWRSSRPTSSTVILKWTGLK